MVAMTNAHSAKQMTEAVTGTLSLAPPRSAHSDQPRSGVKPPSTIPVSSIVAVGIANCVFKFSADALRQAMSGPTPVRNTNTRPIGASHLLKNGGPTVMRSPENHSEMVGNSVAMSTKKAQPRRIQLFKRKANSRDSH